MERLQKLLARAGVASRRRSEQIIVEGRVAVDGEVVTELGAKADPAVQEITVDGTPIAFPERVVVLALHKPTGYLCTRGDQRGRPTVMEFVPEAIRALVYPVGRLDMNSTGLLLLTNDGALAFGLTHPSRHVPKVYSVKAQRPVGAPETAALREGVQLDDGLTATAKVTVDRRDARRLRIVLHEGRKRQLRRMLRAVGNEVVELKRTAIGPLELGDLPEGHIRELSRAEVAALRAAVGIEE